jgi:signal transduction histidine kinase
LETTEKILVGQWDTPRIERVVANLLSNAVKYNLKGGEIEVRVTRTEGELPEQAVGIKERPEGQGVARGAEEEGISCPYAVLVVRDMGIGIPEEELPYIFDWFRRGANVSERFGGAGIGLANVLQIVEQHGGSIAVESQEDIGSTFTVRLPLNR